MPPTLPIATGISGYRREWLSADLIAGISVAAVAIPIAIAYSKLAGVPPVYGLYASLLSLVAYAVLGSSRQLIVAPDAATCAIVAAVVAPLAGPDPARYVSLTAALAMITGVFCIAAGLARLGFLTNFLSRPILTGYLNGIAICIIMGQLGPLCGFPVPSGGFFRMFWHFVSSLGQTHWPTLAIGLATLAMLFLLSRVAKRVPGPLVAMVAGIAASAAFGFADRGVALIGLIPAGIPLPSIPRIPASDWAPLAMGAIGLSLISYNSAMVTARGFATKNRYDIDSNREFIALGAADIGAGLMQGFAVSGADSRTAMNDSMGGKTKLTGLVTAAGIAVTLLFLTGPLASLPVVVLAAVLIKAASGLFDFQSLTRLRRVSRSEFLLSLVTLLGVITVGVLPGVVIAIGLAMLTLLVRASRPHDALLGRDRVTGQYQNLAGHPGAEPVPGIVLYRFDASLVFFNADHLRARARALVHEAPRPVRAFVLVAETIPFLDTTGAAALDQLCEELQAEGIVMAVAGAHRAVRHVLERSGVAERIGAQRIFPTVEVAVQSLQQSVR